MSEKKRDTRPSQRLFTLLAFALAIGALYWAKDVLLPLSLAVLLSFILSPMVMRI